MITIFEGKRERLDSPKRKELNCHRGEVLAVQMSYDGKYVVTAGSEGLIRIWDSRVGMAIGEESAVSVVSNVSSATGRHLQHISDCKEILRGHRGMITSLLLQRDNIVPLLSHAHVALFRWFGQHDQIMEHHRHDLRGHAVAIIFLSHVATATRRSSPASAAPARPWAPEPPRGSSRAPRTTRCGSGRSRRTRRWCTGADAAISRWSAVRWSLRPPSSPAT